MKLSRTATILWTLLSLRKTFISVDQRRFWPYLTDVLEFVNDCNVGKVLDYGHFEQLGVPTESCKAFEDV